MQRITTLLLLAVIGCATVPAKVTDPFPTLGLPIAQARIDNAAGNKPAVGKDLDSVEAAAKQVSASYVDCQEMRNEDDAFITKHSGDYFGAKTHRIAKWIIFLGFPLVAILGVVLTYSGGLPAFAHIVLVIASGGLHGIHLLLLWIINKVKAIRATKANKAIITAGAQ